MHMEVFIDRSGLTVVLQVGAICSVTGTGRTYAVFDVEVQLAST